MTEGLSPTTGSPTSTSAGAEIPASGWLAPAAPTSPGTLLGDLVASNGASHHPHAQTPDVLLAASLPVLAKASPRA